MPVKLLHINRDPEMIDWKALSDIIESLEAESSAKGLTDQLEVVRQVLGDRLGIVLSPDLDVKRDKCGSFEFMKAWHGVLIPRHTHYRKSVGGWYYNPPTEAERAKKPNDVPPALALLKVINDKHCLTDNWNANGPVQSFQKKYRGMFCLVSHPALMSKIAMHPRVNTEESTAIAQRFGEFKENVFRNWVQKILAMPEAEFIGRRVAVLPGIRAESLVFASWSWNSHVENYRASQ